MCKNDEYIDKTAQYLNDTFDFKADAVALSKDDLSVLPANMTAGYGFYKACLFGREFILLYSMDSSAYTPGQMKRHKELVEKKLKATVIFVFDRLVSYNVLRLIKLRINFIIPQKQIFIPDLLVDLKPQRNTEDRKGSQIPVIAQCMALYHLEIKALDCRTTDEIADLFNVSYANVNRAVRWLSENEFITLNGNKTKTVNFHCGKREFWDMLQPFLVNPVERIVYTDDIPDEMFFLSGINGLSTYSMINGEQNGSYAISKETFRKIQVRTNKDYGQYRIEVWRYNPGLLSDNRAVDKLSLYLTMKDIDDERIQIELEQMINNMVW